jgi:hypothetical protein
LLQSESIERILLTERQEKKKIAKNNKMAAQIVPQSILLLLLIPVKATGYQFKKIQNGATVIAFLFLGRGF